MLTSQDLGVEGLSLLWPDTWNPASRNNKSLFDKGEWASAAWQPQARPGAAGPAPILLGLAVLMGKQDSHNQKSSAREREGLRGVAYDPSDKGGSERAPRGTRWAGQQRSIFRVERAVRSLPAAGVLPCVILGQQITR